MPRLTDRYLTTLRLEEGQKDRIVFDSETPGLGVRLTAKGSRTFLVQWTDAATKRKMREPLGKWGSITIDQARRAAQARLGDVARGVDVKAERLKKAAEDAARRSEEALSLERLLGQWERLHLAERRARYKSEAIRAITNAFRSHMFRPAARLTRADVIEVLDAMVESGRGSMAGRTMAYGRALYAWAVKRGRVPTNPFHQIPIAAASTERDRVLTDDEVRAVWAAAGALPYPFGPFYQLALLTLQRRDEVAGMAWSEIDLDRRVWTIPASRMKNNRAHDVHLSAAAIEVLQGIDRFEGQDLVFSTNGRNPISGHSRAKRTIDVKLAGMLGAALPPWRLHDFRRTGVSKIAGLGFDSIVADKLLAHQPAKLRGVASVYQRHSFAEERARALDAWAAFVTRSDAGGNVVQLRAQPA